MVVSGRQWLWWWWVDAAVEQLTLWTHKDERLVVLQPRHDRVQCALSVGGEHKRTVAHVVPRQNGRVRVCVPKKQRTK